MATSPVSAETTNRLPAAVAARPYRTLVMRSVVVPAGVLSRPK